MTLEEFAAFHRLPPRWLLLRRECEALVRDPLYWSSRDLQNKARICALEASNMLVRAVPSSADEGRTGLGRTGSSGKRSAAVKQDIYRDTIDSGKGVTMAEQTSDHATPARASTLTRLPHLAGRLLHFNLAQELRELREQDAWQRGTGRSSKTLAKYPDFRVVLVVMKAGSEMKEHHADARISIQSLQGKLRVHLPDQPVELGAGELICLEAGIHHDVEALEESAFLITVSWPGGSAEERHNRKFS